MAGEPREHQQEEDEDAPCRVLLGRLGRPEDAADLAVKDAAKSLKGIKSIYIENFQADVKDNKIVQYRVNAKITFEVGG